VNVVAGAAQQFPQVGKHIGIVIEAEKAAAGRGGRFSAGCGAVKSGDRFFFGIVRVEKLR